MKTPRTIEGRLRPLLLVGLAGFAVWFGVFATETRDADRPQPRPRELVSPAGLDSGESNLFTGPDGTVYLTWCGQGAGDGERALHLSLLAPGAEEWSRPRMIVSTPLLMENWADFPSLTVGSDGTLWAQWFQRPPNEERGYRGWLARSADRGVTWSEPVPLGHEFVSLAPLSGGRVLAVWLESSRVPRSERKPGDPSMLLLSRLLDRDGATLRDWVVDPDVCNCCQTTLALLGEDRVFVVYRGRTSEEIRDHRHAVFDGDTWGQPMPLHDDGWRIAGCPVNGPAASSLGRSLAAVWFTVAKGVPQVLAKRSADGGATFGPAVSVGIGRPLGRVDLAMLSDASALITWMEMKDGENEAGIYARRLFTNGSLSPAMLVAVSTQARASGFPRIAVRSNDQVVLSWTEEIFSRRVRTVEFAPPSGVDGGESAKDGARMVSNPMPRTGLELCGAMASGRNNRNEMH